MDTDRLVERWMRSKDKLLEREKVLKEEMLAAEMNECCIWVCQVP